MWNEYDTPHGGKVFINMADVQACTALSLYTLIHTNGGQVHYTTAEYIKIVADIDRYVASVRNQNNDPSPPVEEPLSP